MYILHVFRRDGDLEPLDEKKFATDIEAETYFWEQCKPYLDDFASFIITDEALSITYPNSTVPIWAIIFKNRDIGCVVNNGMFVNHAWLDQGNIWDISARSVEWYDLETNTIYRTDKHDIRPMTQEEWDNLKPEQLEQLLNAYKTKN